MKSTGRAPRPSSTRAPAARTGWARGIAGRGATVVGDFVNATSQGALEGREDVLREALHGSRRRLEVHARVVQPHDQVELGPIAERDDRGRSLGRPRPAYRRSSMLGALLVCRRPARAHRAAECRAPRPTRRRTRTGGAHRSGGSPTASPSRRTNTFCSSARAKRPLVAAGLAGSLFRDGEVPTDLLGPGIVGDVAVRRGGRRVAPPRPRTRRARSAGRPAARTAA